ncbi:MAG: ATPase [Desulfobacteraceae bacterium]|nr:ATPase [Desulfobacteraceae bacterium]MBC2753940.1 ATPase [Desulfobacteraceae bacterium]
MRCNQCILSDNTPKIVFDDHGICNYCHDYKEETVKGEESLARELERLRRQDGGYECLVSISGGRDSSYILLKLVKDYGMNVLAVNYENPFTVEQARTNMENAVRILGIDFISFKDEGDRHRKGLQTAVKAWITQPSPSMIPIMCLGCKPAWLSTYRIARKYGIPCIVTGGNPYEVMTFKRTLMNISADEDRERAFMKYAYAAKGIFRNAGYFKPAFVRMMLLAYFFGAPFALGNRFYGRGIGWIQFYDYIQWDEEEILNRIRSELNWSQPAHMESTWRFDCRVKQLVDYMYKKTLDISDKEDFYSKLVREGRMGRKQAIQKAEIEKKIYMDEVRQVLNQIGIDPDFFIERMELL